MYLCYFYYFLHLYCATNKRNSTGLLLLCDVALGNMYERNKIGILELFLIPIDNLLFQCVYPEYVEKLDPCLHSTKGVGKTEPDPAGTKELDGCKVRYRLYQAVFYP